MDSEPTQGEIVRSLLRIEAKIDKIGDDHEQRLRRVERWLYALPPTFLLAVVSLVAAAMGGGT